MSTPWTVQNVPGMTGKTVLITGANSGIGFEAAKVFAAKGAQVVMACRNLEKAMRAADEIRSGQKNAQLDVMTLDLASLASVRQFAAAFVARYSKLDLLINNAGVMVPPFTRTAEGFEVQFGANHLGHFALTGLLLETLLATPGARVVNISSGMHRRGTGTIDFDNLNAEKGYHPANAYAQSKLANLLFTFELNRRLVEAGSGLISVAAHPGWTLTGLQKGLIHTISEWIGQKPEMGALPTLRAAVDPQVSRNDYFGPDSWMELRGYPKKVETSDAAKDPALAKRLWEVSENLSGVRYSFPVTA